MRPTRRELAWLLASWLGWAFVALHIQGPWDTMFGGGDHWSHVGCAELFLHHGFNLWDHPPGRYCSQQLPPGQQGFLAESGCRVIDVCVEKDRPGSRPLCINWQMMSPQAYPPGLILYSLPQALLYEHTSLSFRAIDVLTIWEYLAAAHLLFFLLLRIVFTPRRRDDLPGGASWELENQWLRRGLFALLYLFVIKMCFNGFYDPLAVAAVFFGIYYLAKRQPVEAVLALSVSYFLHYRALWYAPLMAVAAVRALPVIFASPRKSLPKIALATVLMALFAYTFFLLYPFLRNFPQTNPAHLQSGIPWTGRQLDLLIPMALLGLYLAWGRHWLMLATMAWQLLIITRTYQVFDWHALFLLPVLGVARLDEERGVMLAAVVFYLVEAAVIFNALPLPGDLIAAIGTQWGPATFW